MRKNYELIFAFLMFFCVNLGFAQSVTINGKVTEKGSNEELFGVTVLINGTGVGSTTDFDGNYTFKANDTKGKNLTFSYIGYETFTVLLTGENQVIDASLTQSATQLDEVVVTALGIKKEQKALGYSLTKVGGDELSEVRTTSAVNALQGRVAGVNISTSSAGAAGPTGLANDGEVEDHLVTIANGYVNWGNIQWPTNEITTYIGTASEDVYGQCWHDGITPPSTNSSRRIYAQIGYGLDGTNPWDAGWQWFNAGFNSQTSAPNNEEFVSTLTIDSAGTYDYAFRYSLNNSDWTLGDIDGSQNGYTNTQAGSIVVTALSPFSITNIGMVATSDTATVMWDAEARVVYQLQYVTELPTNTPPWSNIGGEVTGNTQTDTTATTTRFYRVIAPYAK